MLTSLKSNAQKYAGSVTSVLTFAVTVASFFYGPMTIGGQVIPQASSATTALMGAQALAWVLHHVAAPPAGAPAVPASLPGSGK